MEPFSITAGVAGLLGAMATIGVKLSALKQRWDQSGLNITMTYSSLASVRRVLELIQRHREKTYDTSDASRQLEEDLTVPLESCAVLVAALERSLEGIDVENPSRMERGRFITLKETFEQAERSLDIQLRALQVMLTIYQYESAAEQRERLNRRDTRKMLDHVRQDTASAFQRLEEQDVSDVASLLSREPSVKFPFDYEILQSPMYKRVYHDLYLKYKPESSRGSVIAISPPQDSPMDPPTFAPPPAPQPLDYTGQVQSPIHSNVDEETIHATHTEDSPHRSSIATSTQPHSSHRADDLQLASPPSSAMLSPESAMSHQEKKKKKKRKSSSIQYDDPSIREIMFLGVPFQGETVEQPWSEDESEESSPEPHEPEKLDVHWDQADLDLYGVSDEEHAADNTKRTAAVEKPAISIDASGPEPPASPPKATERMSSSSLPNGESTPGITRALAVANAERPASTISGLYLGNTELERLQQTIRSQRARSVTASAVLPSSKSSVDSRHGSTGDLDRSFLDDRRREPSPSSQHVPNPPPRAQTQPPIHEEQIHEEAIHEEPIHEEPIHEEPPLAEDESEPERSESIQDEREETFSPKIDLPFLETETSAFKIDFGSHSDSGSPNQADEVIPKDIEQPPEAQPPQPSINLKRQLTVEDAVPPPLVVKKTPPPIPIISPPPIPIISPPPPDAPPPAPPTHAPPPLPTADLPPLPPSPEPSSEAASTAPSLPPPMSPPSGLAIPPQPLSAPPLPPRPASIGRVPQLSAVDTRQYRSSSPANYHAKTSSMSNIHTLTSTEPARVPPQTSTAPPVPPPRPTVGLAPQRPPPEPPRVPRASNDNEFSSSPPKRSPPIPPKVLPPSRPAPSPRLSVSSRSSPHTPELQNDQPLITPLQTQYRTSNPSPRHNEPPILASPVESFSRTVPDDASTTGSTLSGSQTSGSYNDGRTIANTVGTQATSFDTTSGFTSEPNAMDVARQQAILSSLGKQKSKTKNDPGSLGRSKLRGIPSKASLTKMFTSKDKAMKVKVLHDAARRGDRRILADYLAENRNAINRLEKLDDEVIAKSLFMRAAESDQVECMEYLVQNGAEYALADRDGRAALHHAVQAGNFKSTKWLAEHFQAAPQSSGNSAPVGPLDLADKDGFRPLHIAAGTGNVPVIDLLLERGATINQIDRYGRTALFPAIIGNRIDAIKRLLECGASISHEDGDKHTPLMWAAEANSPKAVSLLLEKGANRYAVDHQGNSAIHLAAKSGSLAVVEMLYMSLEDLEAGNRVGERPIHLAAASDQAHVVKALLTIGCDVMKFTWPNANRRTLNKNATYKDHPASPLHYACANGAYDPAVHLIEHGAQVNAGQQDGTSALMLAASAGSAPVCSLLIENLANLDARTSTEQWTPLHFGLVKGDLDTVKLLVHSGADLKMRTRKKQTPWQLATKDGDPTKISEAARWVSSFENTQRREILRANQQQYHSQQQQQLLSYYQNPNPWPVYSGYPPNQPNIQLSGQYGPLPSVPSPGNATAAPYWGYTATGYNVNQNRIYQPPHIEASARTEQGMEPPPAYSPPGTRPAQ